MTWRESLFVCTASFAHMKDPPLQKMNAQKLVIAISFIMHYLGAKLMTSESVKGF